MHEKRFLTHGRLPSLFIRLRILSEAPFCFSGFAL
jgi:hypothetical protein